MQKGRSAEGQKCRSAEVRGRGFVNGLTEMCWKHVTFVIAGQLHLVTNDNCRVSGENGMLKADKERSAETFGEADQNRHGNFREKDPGKYQ